jgi:hypothetical protein
LTRAQLIRCRKKSRASKLLRSFAEIEVKRDTPCSVLNGGSLKKQISRRRDGPNQRGLWAEAFFDPGSRDFRLLR